MSGKRKTTVREGAASDEKSDAEGVAEHGAAAGRVTDSPGALRIHLLDIGGGEAHKYGDCVLCQFGDVSVLIDGGHRGDEELVLRQLKKLLKQRSPVTVSLIVISHPHDDHIGCLPKLVAQGELKAEWALVADPQYRWGKPGDTDDDFAWRDGPARGLAEAVLEHDRVEWSDDELAGFVDAVANLETRYRTMLRQLEEAGTRVVRHATDAEAEAELVEAFASVGLEVFGPTLEQLQECYRLVKLTQTDSLDSLDSLDSAADSDLRSAAGVANVYRGLLDGVTDSARKNRGAINLQSLVTRFEYDGRRVIFGGDMQFADPQVESQMLHDGVTELRRRIRDDAPYAFVKLSHHGSDNAFDERTMPDYGESALYGICCGDYRKGHHPHPEVLSLLDENRENLDWVRTDRNGLVSITFGPDGPDIKLSRGRVDDETPPTGDSDGDVSDRPADSEPDAPRVAPPPDGGAYDAPNYHFSARVPPNARRLSVVIDLDPAAAQGGEPGRAPAAEFSVATDAYFDPADPQVYAAGHFPSGELTPNSGDDVEAEPGSAEFIHTDADCNVPWRAANSLMALLRQVNQRAPRRNKASDGTIGDAAHCQRTSDHNPWVRDGGVGVVTALDITHDPRGGCDANTIVEAIRASRDRRVKYIIWNRRIANSAAVGGAQPWEWRRYTGRNPHTVHAHISVKPDKASYDSTAAWAI